MYPGKSREAHDHRQSYRSDRDLDRRTRENPYFAKRALSPSIDYDEAILYHAIRFPQEFFSVLSAMPRFIGWIARWKEMLTDPGHRTDRSPQIHVGEPPRPYVPIDRRR